MTRSLPDLLDTDMRKLTKERHVYLGDGVWWRITEKQYQQLLYRERRIRRLFKGIRPYTPHALALLREAAE